MATRSLMALDYANFNSNSVLKKHARNRALGDLEHKHSYIPAQPVLSCRTVDIDLPGTRTYRPRSTVDILEEQQKLIRNLYTKQRAATAAPTQQRTVDIAPPRSAGVDSVRRVNIEVKGRPLTSGSHSGYQSEHTAPVTAQRRPRTTGRLKNIQPATDCFMIVKTDKELVETTRHTRELTNRLRSYWNTESNSLAQGRFVRGQKRPDDVPPTLDAWLTFGGAAGEGSEGVIDAFASFKNSQEYYNIEGSVGSRVAKQLQKGDKIRIGINGVLQSQDLKVRKWNKGSSVVGADREEEGAEGVGVAVETTTDETSTVGATQTDAQTEEEQIEIEKEGQTEELVDQQQTDEPVELTNGHSEVKESLPEFEEFQDDFKELMIGDLDDMLEDFTVEDPAPKEVVDRPKSGKENGAQRKGQSNNRTRQQKKSAPPRQLSEESTQNGEAKIKMTIPLSWDDQCTKEDVKVINARISGAEVIRPIMSETHPVKFEKLINGESRPWLAQPKIDGFRVKQRTGTTPNDPILGRPLSSSKVKVMYIDHLSQEEEARVQGMSVDQIVNYRVRDSLSRQNTADVIHRGFKQCDDGLIAINDDTDGEPRRSRQSSSKSSHSRSGRPMSNSSLHSEKQGIPSPKLKTVPVHSAIRPAGEIGISAYSARRTPVQQQSETSRQGKPPGGRLSPAKPLHKAGAGSGSSIKVGGLQGDTEFIKITSQMKISNTNPRTGSPDMRGAGNGTQFTPYNFSPGSNTPRDLDYQEVTYDPSDVLVSPEQPTAEDANQKGAQARTVSPPPPGPGSKAGSSGQASPNKAQSSKAGDEDDAVTAVSDSPTLTAVAISIPTADELSDRDSPSTSPVRKDDELSKQERKARNMRDEQIGQLTDLLGGAIVDS